MSDESCDVVIVGAGLSGLGLGFDLKQQSVDFRILERSERVGGLLQTARVDGYAIEHAAPAFRAAAPGVFDLAQDLELATLRAAPEAKKRYLWHDEELHQLPTSPPALLTSPLLSLRGKLRLLAEPFIRRRDNSDESVFEFMTRRFGPEVAQIFASPFVAGIYASDAREIAMRGAFPQVAELESGLGVILSGIRRQMANKPADARTGLQSFVGGMETLIEALDRQLEDEIRTDLRVVSLTRQDDKLILKTTAQTFRCKSVVLTTPANVSAELVAGINSEASGALERSTFSPLVIVALGFSKTGVNQGLRGFGYLSTDQEDPALGAVFESATWPGRAPEGHALYRVMLGGSCHPYVLGFSDEELIERAITALLRAKVVSSPSPSLTYIKRWPKAIVQMTNDHTKHMRRASELLQKQGVWLAGGSIHGVGVNHCAQERKRVAPPLLKWLATSLFLLIVACSGSRKLSEEARDAKAVTKTSSSQTSQSAPVYKRPVKVTVSWVDAPANKVTSQGRTSCGGATTAPLSVHTLGGIRNTVVYAEPADAKEMPHKIDIKVKNCQFDSPIYAVSGPAQVTVHLLDGRQSASITAGDKILASWQSIAPGEARALTLPPGTYSLISDGAKAHIWVGTPSQVAAVTNNKGQTTLKPSSANKQITVGVWHPHLPGISAIAHNVNLDPPKTLSLRFRADTKKVEEK